MAAYAGAILFPGKHAGDPRRPADRPSAGAVAGHGGLHRGRASHDRERRAHCARCRRALLFRSLPAGALNYNINGIASFSVTALADSLSEGQESYTIQIGNWDGTNFTSAQSAVVNVTDSGGSTTDATPPA